jgi:hypothetical protein
MRFSTEPGCSRCLSPQNLDRLRRRWSAYLFSANGAGFTTSLGQRPSLVKEEFLSAESAIHFQHPFDRH